LGSVVEARLARVLDSAAARRREGDVKGNKLHVQPELSSAMAFNCLHRERRDSRTRDEYGESQPDGRDAAYDRCVEEVTLDRVGRILV